MVIVMAAKTATRTGAKAELADRILQFARQQPEDYLLTPERLGRFGRKCDVKQALNMLESEGHVLHIYDDVYVAAIPTRFGVSSPPVEDIVKALMEFEGEVAVRNAATAANRLRMCNQLCVSIIYLTSGASKKIKAGWREVELRHAPAWMVLFDDDNVSGLALRAMDLDGPKGASKSADHIRRTIKKHEWEQLKKDVTANKDIIPQWVQTAILNKAQ